MLKGGLLVLSIAEKPLTCPTCFFPSVHITLFSDLYFLIITMPITIWAWVTGNETKHSHDYQSVYVCVLY